jgi:hypothetical protein
MHNNDVRQTPFTHPPENVIQWLVDVLEIIFFLSRRWGETPQVQALACGSHDFMFVLQAVNLKEASHALNQIAIS